MKYTIVEMTEETSLCELQGEWQQLFRASRAVPFLSWEWISAWHRWLGQHLSPRIICVRGDDQLLGLLALGEEAIGVAGMKLKRLSLLGAKLGGADYLGVLARAGHEENVAALIAEHLAAQRDVHWLELEELASDGITNAALENAFATNSQTKFQRCPRYTCPQIELDADWPTVLKRSRRADNFKRRLRQLKALPDFADRSVSSPGEIKAAFARFRQLHEARWENRGGSEATGHDALVQFHEEVVTKFAQNGWVRFEELWCEGACRATIYGVETNGQFFYFNAGFDPAWARYSVGLVLLGLSISHAIERGIRVYDFLRGTEGYKSDWATTTRATVAIQIARQHWPTTFAVGVHALRQELKTIAQAHLPAPWQQSLRALKRQYLLGR